MALNGSPVVSASVPFTGGTINDTTIASTKSLVVTTADKLTVGAVIVPQTKTIVWKPIVTDLTQAIFIADEAYQVIGVNACWGVASISGTLQVEKLTGTTAPGSGTSMLTGTVSLAGTANTVTAGTLSGTVGNLQLAAGDRIGGVLGGTLTALLGATVVITLKRI